VATDSYTPILRLRSEKSRLSLQIYYNFSRLALVDLGTIIHNWPFMWIGQGKPTIFENGRFVLQTQNIVVYFWVDLKLQFAKNMGYSCGVHS